MRTSEHFEGQLLERVGKTWDQLVKEFEYQVVKAGETTTHRIVSKKQKRYPHQDFIVFEDANLFVAADGDRLVTAMYLDGRWGYKNRAYDASEHYGKK